MGKYTDLQSVAPKVDSPPRYLDAGSGGKLLRPENQAAYDAAPSISAQRRALTLAGFMASSALPDPDVIALFGANTYEFGGASKVFADCFTTSYSPTESATADIVADEGLSIDFIGGGTGTGASATLISTAGFEASLNPALGFTGTIDVTPVFSDPAEQVYLSAFFNSAPGNIGFGINPKGGGGAEMAIVDSSSGGDVSVVAIADIVSGRKYRLAFSVNPNLLMLSVNGAAPLTRVPSVALDFSGARFKLYAALFSGVAGSYTRVDNFLGRPYTADAAQLRALSAL